MHELSLCGAIADIACRRAGGRNVAVIHLQVGALRQVVPDTLSFCWSMVTAETELDGSLLDLERVAARLTCRACATTFDPTEPMAFCCPSCGGFDVEVEAGEEFAVTALQFAPA